MVKSILLCISLYMCYFASAQVGINTESPHSTAALDISNNPNKGLLAPRVGLLHSRDVLTIPNPKKGLLVFNTSSNSELTPGYYYYNNEKWEPFYNITNEVVQGISNNIYASTLGYVPFGFAEYSLSELSYYGATSLKRECFQFTDSFNGAVPHKYCGYTMEGPVTWEQAFEFAKYQKGYLATITSEAEWQAIKDNLLSLGENADNNIWIGYNTIQSPGNESEYTWITGEKSVINWSNSSILQTFYASGEPDGDTGCVYIANKATSPNRNWYDTECNKNEVAGKPFNYIIIEFHD
jgi:hypothetical protein